MRLLAIAHLTLLELWRQRTHWGFLLVGLILALPALMPAQGLSINGSTPMAEAVAGGLLSFAQFIALFLAIASTAGLVSGDTERGTVLLLASKPLRRPTLLLGKLFGGGAYLTLAWLGWGLVAAGALSFKFGPEHFAPVFLGFLASSLISWLVVAFTLFWSTWLPAGATMGLAVLSYMLLGAAPQAAEAMEAMGKPMAAAVLTWLGRALPAGLLADHAKALLQGMPIEPTAWWPLLLILAWWAAAALVYARRDLGSVP